MNNDRFEILNFSSRVIHLWPDTMSMSDKLFKI